MKKWLIMGASALVLIAVAMVVTYHALLSKNFIVSQIEASIDSRVQVGDFGVNLFSVPAQVVISEVIIAERDDAARKGVPHDDRSPLEGGAIRVEEISFDLSLRQLLSKQIKVSQLKVVGAHSELVMNEAGELNVAKLFAAPPEADEQAAEKEDLNAKDSPGMVTALDRLIIKDASFNLVIQKTGLEIEGRDVNLKLFDIKVDPSALEKVNQGKLNFAARFAAYSSNKERLKYGQIALDGPAQVRLFDPATGDLSPAAEIAFAIDPDSYVSAKAPYIVKLWNVTDQLVKIGLKAKPLPDRLTFGRERMLTASYAGNRLDLHQPVSLVLEDWELVLDGGSWVELGSDQHASGVRLIAGAKVSEFVGDHLLKLTEIAPEKVRADLQQEILGQVFVDDRLNLKVGTRGPLSDPKVELKTRLPDAEKMVKEHVKTKALDYLFKKLQE